MPRPTVLSAAALLGALLLPQGVTAEITQTAVAGTDRRLNQIADTEWQLRHSSIASAIDKSVQDNAISLLDKARQEVAAGQLSKADTLIEQAAQPLHRMTPDALAGKHPDPRQWLDARRETLSAITASGEKIARDQGASTQFVAQATTALAQSHALQQQGKIDQALAAIEQAYRAVQEEIARLRDGQAFYLAISERPADHQWSDGLRRFEERRQLTELLISEARAEGIDASPLLSGLQEAEQIRIAAARLAETRRWDKAVQSLEIAYLRFEDSWRQVGLEW